MKTRHCLGAAALLLLLGAAPTTSAQQSKPDQAVGPKSEAPQPARPIVGLRGRLPESPPPTPEPSMERGERWWMWHRYRAGTWRYEHRTWQQRGGYSGYRIPLDQFRGKFGPDHWFRIADRQLVMIGGRPRFEFGGYWFSPVDPWPEFWADNWYETDEVYIVATDDGYYLCDRSYPDDRIAVDVYVD